MALLPTSLILNAKVDGGGFSAAVQRFPDLLRSAGISLKAKFELGPDHSKGSLEQALLAAKDPPSGEASLSIEWPEGVNLEAAVHPVRTSGLVSLVVSLDIHADRDLVQRSDQAVRLARFLASEFKASELFVVRSHGSNSRICPTPPLGITLWEIILASQEEIAKHYDDPDAYWAAGWDRREDLRSGSLLSRGTSLADDVDYLRQVAPMQWQLARAAKKGETKYSRPKVEPELETVYRQGESVLRPVGYADEARLAEFSCYLGEGQHIPGWEIYTLWNILQSHALSDGRKVDALRVVFLTREMAWGERRPLLDIGAKVFYQDEPGKLTEITD